MISVNEERLESDLGYRFQYLAEFMGFSADDIATIHAAAPVSYTHLTLPTNREV